MIISGKKERDIVKKEVLQGRVRFVRFPDERRQTRSQYFYVDIFPALSRIWKIVREAQSSVGLWITGDSRGKRFRLDPREKDKSHGWKGS